MANIQQFVLDSFKKERDQLQVVAAKVGATPMKVLLVKNGTNEVPLFDFSNDELQQLAINVVEDRDGLTINGDGWMVFTSFGSTGFNVTGRFDKEDSWLA